MVKYRVTINKDQCTDCGIAAGRCPTHSRVLARIFDKKGEKIFYFQDIYVYTEFFSNNIKKFIRHRIRWARDLFISQLSKLDIIKLIISFLISIFKLFYPVVAIFIAILFFNYFYLFLFLLPWIGFYVLYLIIFYFKLKKMSIKAGRALQKRFNHKKAFKIIPLLFFIYGIITFISLIYPKRKMW